MTNDRPRPLLVDDAPRTTAPDELDGAVAAVAAAAAGWARLPVVEKAGVLEEIITRVVEQAPAWVADAVAAKGIPAGSPLAGEEWISGPWALIEGAQAYRTTLLDVAAGRDPLRKVPVRIRGNGQLVLDVFPATVFDRLLLSGYRAEVWMQPGVGTADLPERTAPFHRRTAPAGQVSLVLGAGNIASIAPLDLLHEAFVRGATVVVKMNPVNDYLGPHLETIFEPMIAADRVRIVYGGADVGARLCEHPLVDHVHITGSARTHDAIVFGGGDEGRRRKAAGDPVLSKPITSELGGIGATIVVPGPWGDADIAYQAENLASMKLHNAGCNCVAMQVLVLPAQWDRTDGLVGAVEERIRSIDPRAAYYPGAERRHALVAEHPAARDLDDRPVPRTIVPDVDPAVVGDACFTEEAFGGTLATTRLGGDGAQAFLDAAVDFCNDVLDGTLGIQLLVHPATIDELGADLDAAIARLRYGTIGVNCWNAVGYLLARVPWGAYPGHTLHDVGSGIGTVHNGLMLEGTEKSVIHGPWRTFPRSTRHLDAHLATKPPWFVTHRKADVLGERLTRFAAHPSWRALPGLFPPALTG